jgi:hypothetical protein
MRVLIFFLALLLVSCATLSAPKVTKYAFPKEEAFLNEPKRPFEVIGRVRTKVTWQSLNPDQEESALCSNYFNKAVIDLVKRARDKGADAIIKVQSVVFLVDGRQEIYSTPECADDGEEGQVLAQALAVKWKETKPEVTSVEPK